MPSQVTPLDLEGDCQWPLGVKKREEESQTAEVKTRHYAKTIAGAKVKNHQSLHVQSCSINIPIKSDT